MAKKLGASKRGIRQGSNPARVAAMQARLKSSAYGSHQQPEDRPRAAREREALEEELTDLEDD
jgi:hypothetical protein